MTGRVWRLFILISIAATTWAANSETAEAQVAACRSYANTAVTQNRENIRRRCGFGGSRWQSNGRAHFAWCMRVSPGARASETRARARMLRNCRARSGRGDRAFCRNYANTAVNRNRENQRRGCRYRGSRWQNNAGNHFRWCMNADRSRARAETRARAQLLDRCRGSGRRGIRAFCQDYAATAVRQNRLNIRNGCRYGGSRWQSNANRHYRWCVGAGRARANRETQARNDMLRRCGVRGGPGGGRGRCDLRNARINVRSPGCDVESGLPFSRRAIRNGERIRLDYNSGPIGRGRPRHGVCNFRTDIIYRCERGRLVVDRVIECQQNRTGRRGARCRIDR